MPFKSEAQRRFMYAKHPKIAKRWSKKYGKQKNLPEKIGNDEKDYVKSHYAKRKRTRLN